MKKILYFPVVIFLCCFQLQGYTINKIINKTKSTISIILLSDKKQKSLTIDAEKEKAVTLRIPTIKEVGTNIALLPDFLSIRLPSVSYLIVGGTNTEAKYEAIWYQSFKHKKLTNGSSKKNQQNTDLPSIRLLDYDTYHPGSPQPKKTPLPGCTQKKLYRCLEVYDNKLIITNLTQS